MPVMALLAAVSTSGPLIGAGGTLRAEPRIRGGYRVEAVIPFEPVAPAPAAAAAPASPCE